MDDKLVDESENIVKTILGKRIKIISKNVDVSKRVVKVIVAINNFGKKIEKKLKYYNGVANKGKLNERISKECDLVMSLQNRFQYINIEYDKIDIKKLSIYNEKMAKLQEEVQKAIDNISDAKEDNYKKIQKLSEDFDVVYDEYDIKLNIVNEQLTSIENDMDELEKDFKLKFNK